MLTSYHVHSTLSDGASTVREHILAALDAGLDEIGISDHYVLLPDHKAVDWSLPPSALPAYFDEIRSAAAEVEGKLVVRYGIEADFDPQTASELAEILRAYPFDYVIGSVHFVEGFAVDECAENWDALTQPERNGVIRAYWECIARMARSGLFDFAGHLDLYKKFGHVPTVDISEEIGCALDAIAASGMAVELNTAGWYKEIQEAYPSCEIMRECRARGIPMLVTADAHNACELTRGFDRAVRALRDAGYTQTVVYAGRKTGAVQLV